MKRKHLIDRRQATIQFWPRSLQGLKVQCPRITSVRAGSSGYRSSSHGDTERVDGD